MEKNAKEQEIKGGVEKIIEEEAQARSVIREVVQEVFEEHARKVQVEDIPATKEEVMKKDKLEEKGKVQEMDVEMSKFVDTLEVPLGEEPKSSFDMME
ncbi:hypothetical protein GOP47_0010671 [Adiantum capillus-veneris]|uniref:Uncharacterized protein n=1 Tax=Adiantum capillus-veneris TaxID=13818 RepID=A0A9D4ZJ08_ADICA|nr:hypothetical protein GOP47_0010671 [Adiantum capillus-veneris]